MFVQGGPLESETSETPRQPTKTSHLTGLTNTILHLAYLAWKETAVVLETGRRKPMNDSVLAFHRNLRVAGRASGERVGGNPPRKAFPRKAEAIENIPK